MNEKLVTVARYTDYTEADLARQTLEDEGIKAFVMGQNARIAWGAPLDEIELQTPESQAQDAKEILKAASEQETDPSEKLDDEGWDDEDEASDEEPE